MKHMDCVKNYWNKGRYAGAIIIALILLNSCKEDKYIQEIIPSTCVSGDFAFKSPFSVSSSSIDFSTSADTISASFTEPVSWILTLTGNTSGAKRIYRGHTDTLCVIWRGQPGISKLYTSNEDVKVELSIPCFEVFSHTIHITQTVNFEDLGNILSDFDGSGTISDNNVTMNSFESGKWNGYYASPNSLLTQAEMVTSPLTAPQGSGYLTLKGTAGSASWFGGGVYAEMPSTIPVGNADDIYLNAFINSGNSTTSELDFSVSINSNPPFTYRVPITWTGWKMVSIKLSDFKNTMNQSLSNTSGVNVIDLSLLSSIGTGRSSEANIDFILFTVDEPLYDE